jgi:hypothetical protein
MAPGCTHWFVVYSWSSRAWHSRCLFQQFPMWLLKMMYTKAIEFQPTVSWSLTVGKRTAPCHKTLFLMWIIGGYFMTRTRTQTLTPFIQNVSCRIKMGSLLETLPSAEYLVLADGQSRCRSLCQRCRSAKKTSILSVFDITNALDKHGRKIDVNYASEPTPSFLRWAPDQNVTYMMCSHLTHSEPRPFQCSITPRSSDAKAMIMQLEQSWIRILATWVRLLG